MLTAGWTYLTHMQTRPVQPNFLSQRKLSLIHISKMETMIEALNAGGENTGWLGYNRLLETNIRKTSEL